MNPVLNSVTVHRGANSMNRVYLKGTSHRRTGRGNWSCWWSSTMSKAGQQRSAITRKSSIISNMSSVAAAAGRLGQGQEVLNGRWLVLSSGWTRGCNHKFIPCRLIESNAVMKCKPYGQIVFLFCQQSHTYSSIDRCHTNVMKQGIAGSTYIPSTCLVVLFWITYPYRIRYSVVNAFLFPRFLLYFLCQNSVVIFLFLSSWILPFSILFFTPLHFLFLPHTV